MAESQSDVTDNDFQVPPEDNSDNETEQHDTTEKIRKSFRCYFCEFKQSYTFPNQQLTLVNKYTRKVIKAAQL